MLEPVLSSPLQPVLRSALGGSLPVDALPYLVNGLIGLWTNIAFNESDTVAVDYSTNGNNATLKSGRAVDIDGISEYVLIPDLGTPVKSFTVRSSAATTIYATDDATQTEDASAAATGSFNEVTLTFTNPISGAIRLGTNGTSFSATELSDFKAYDVSGNLIDAAYLNDHEDATAAGLNNLPLVTRIGKVGKFVGGSVASTAEAPVPQIAGMDWNKFGRTPKDSDLSQLPSGLALAYSLRDGITSNVVRVRRSSDNAEADFTGVEVHNGTLTTFTGAGDGFLVTIYDLSGNSRHGSPPTTAAQPRIVIAGSLVTASHGGAGLDFDGIDDQIMTPYPMPSDQFFVASVMSTDTSVSVVGTWGNQAVSGAFSGGIHESIQGSGAQTFFRLRNLTDDGFVDLSSVNLNSLTNLNLGCFWSDVADNPKTAYNGESEITASASTDFSARSTEFIRISLGTATGRWLNDRFCEFLLWDSAKGSERRKIENNIFSYYELPLGDLDSTIIPKHLTNNTDAFGNALVTPRIASKTLNVAGGGAVEAPDIAAYASIKTVIGWYNHDGIDKTIFDLGIPLINATSDVLGSTGITAPTYYVNGVASTALNVGWNFITVTTATAFDGGPLAATAVTDAFGVYSDEKTVGDILLMYNTSKANFGL